MKPVTRVAAVALALGISASSAAAQLVGNPVYFSPKGGTGLTLGADFGMGVNDDAKPVPGETPTFFGARASLGLPMLTIGLGGGLYGPGGAADREFNLAGTAAFRVFGGGPMPVSVSLQAGAGWMSTTIGTTDVTNLNFPIGAGISFSPPSPGVSFEVWGAPRVHINRASGGGTSTSETGFGASAGVNIGLPMGLGFHVAADYLTIGDPSVKPMHIGAGIHYKFSVPGMGAAGM